jgi:hypothetical protein
VAERGTLCANEPVSLDAYRLRRRVAADLARRSPAAQPPAGVKPTYLAAEPGRVLLRFSDGAELELAPEHARTWAERLAAMADVAEAMAKDGGAGG